MAKKKSSKRKKQSNPSRSKKQFVLQDGETIDQCLERIAAEGFTPIRRIEKPIFAEQSEDGETKYQPVSRKVIFDAVPVKDEH
ncbi:NETI motif-containing protein [Sediminibacillus albus]|uniref:NETI protein n=1 Tax=Sediminibacillus albus TaxID=407036 RepID=A0A1G9BDF6_9BACI|nr:NETI motif-containing protein [Sediminibacillus albus]SDK37160.1 NETI protein [Sediminibacillus albus]